MQPKKTQLPAPIEQLTTDDIRERLTNFEQINNPKELKYSDIVQYFEILDDGNFKYKMGGFVTINKFPDYLMLTNGKKTWSVQIRNHIFFRAIQIEKIKTFYEKIIAEKNRKIDELEYLLLSYKKKHNL